MSHNLDMTNGRANIAFIGDRADIWHGMGQSMKPGMSIPEWAKAAGLDWEAVKVPAIANLVGPKFDHIAPADRFRIVEGKNHVVRSDTGLPLGFVSNQYHAVQPAEVLEWFERYIGVDDRFQLDVAGSLKGGAIIWATATFRDALSVAGDKHVARLLMTTTFDGSGSTINQGTMTRVVCNNTLDVALSDRRAMIRTTHRSKFDAKRVGDELAAVAQGFGAYKAMGEAMALNKMAVEEVSALFKHVLEIPFDAKKEDISSRRLNQFDALNDAYAATVKETAGVHAGTAWAALNAITRWVDHGRNGEASKDVKAFSSSQFGSGADVKANAVAFLMPRIKDAIKVAA